MNSSYMLLVLCSLAVSALCAPRFVDYYSTTRPSTSNGPCEFIATCYLNSYFSLRTCQCECLPGYVKVFPFFCVPNESSSSSSSGRPWYSTTTTRPATTVTGSTQTDSTPNSPRSTTPYHHETTTVSSRPQTGSTPYRTTRF